jgi:NAD(P)-dependent dehydrogenase (short-subunit alcohol dehydrogenase family)
VRNRRPGERRSLDPATPASSSPRRQLDLPAIGRVETYFVYRAALVTGGSSGIGLAIARMLRDEGFELTLASRRPEKVEAAARELGAEFVAADVSREEDCTRLVDTHRERFGRLDVLVNSAGIGIGGRIEDLATKHWDLQFGVNIRGLFIVTRESLPLLRESRGLVVNIASIAGTISSPGLAAYGATKASVIALTRTLNAELDGEGVRCTALCPGFVDTPMAESSGIPQEEMIRPEDCAEVVRMLLRLGPHARIPQVVIERAGSSETLG